MSSDVPSPVRRGLLRAAFASAGLATYAVFAVLERRLTSWATRRQDAAFGGGG